MEDCITLILKDREYRVEALPIRKDREWREEMVKRLKPVIDTLPGLPDMDFSKPDDFLKLTELVQHILTDGLDDVVELLFLYSPALRDDRQWIEDNVPTRQMVNAFLEVIQLDNPFDFKRFRERFNGQGNGEISKN